MVLDEHALLDSPVCRLDARLKIVLALAFVVVVVSTPPRAYSAFAGYAVLLLSVLVLARLPIGFVLKRLALVLPFVGAAALFLPFLPEDTVGGGYSLGWGGLVLSRTGLLVFWNILAKALMGALAALLLTSTTPFPKLLVALAQLRVPRTFILITSFAYRYLFVLVDEAQRMARARDSRCCSRRWLWQAAVIGQMIAMLFLRSYERAERVYMAMLARGFDGSMPVEECGRLAARDCACACGVSVALLTLRLCAL